MTTPNDPHARLLARYRETLAETRRLDDQPVDWTGESNAAHAAYWQAFVEVVTTPPETMAGLLIVATILAEDILGTGSCSWKDNLDQRAAINLRDGIARLGGAS